VKDDTFAIAVPHPEGTSEGVLRERGSGNTLIVFKRSK